MRGWGWYIFVAAALERMFEGCMGVGGCGCCAWSHDELLGCGKTPDVNTRKMAFKSSACIQAVKTVRIEIHC